MAKTAEGLRPFETPTIFLLGGAKKTPHFFTFVYQTIDCLGQFDMSGCECLCSVVAIALGTKPWELGFEPASGQNYFFQYFLQNILLSYVKQF